jgi:hypothetical protein
VAIQFRLLTKKSVMYPALAIIAVLQVNPNSNN